MELFKLVGSIIVDNDKANKSIKKTDDHAESLGHKFMKGIKTLGKWKVAIVGAASASVGALLGVANASASAMDEIDKMSAKIGISKKGYQEWKYVLGQNGMEIDKMQVGVKTLITKMDSASKGSENASLAFSKLGLSIYDSNGKLKDQEVMMQESLYALADMENGTEKARLATELFGKAGVEMMPMLNNGSQGMKDLTKRAHDLGLVVGDDAVSAGVTFGDTMDDLKQSFGMIGLHVGNFMIPMFQKLADWILNGIPGIRKAFGKMGDKFSQVADVIMNYINKLKPYWNDFIKELKVVWDKYGKPIFDIFGQMIGEVFSIFGSCWPEIERLFGAVFKTISTIWKTLGRPIFDTLLFCVKSAKSMFDYVFPYIREVFRQAITVITNLVNTVLMPAFNFIGNFLSATLLPIFQFVFGTVAGTIKHCFDTIYGYWTDVLKPTFDAVIDFVGNVFSGNWSAAWDNCVSILRGIWNGIKKILTSPIEGAKNVIKGIIDSIKRMFNIKLEFPKIKLPHFSLKPKGWEIGDLLKGKIPKLGIEWYAKAMDKGMILDKPTIFGAQNGKLLGAGEVGSETVVGTHSLLDMIRGSVSNVNHELKEVLLKIYELLADDERIYRIFVRALNDGSFGIELDGRIVGRVIRKYA